MAVMMVFVFTVAACLLFSVRRRRWPGVAGGSGSRRDAGPLPGRAAFGAPGSVRRGGQEISMPRLARQLAALLTSGRNGPVLWAALADVLAAEQMSARRRPGGEGHRYFARLVPGPPATPGDELERHPAIALIRAVERASALGLPTAEAVRSACWKGAGRPETGGGRRGAGGLPQEQRQVWLELAACLEVCEVSGAPVAAVLARLADRLETEEDTAELRKTALAGPRATVRLLAWLPFVGLGLGMAMGVDPLGVLLGGPFGWACLGTGLALVAAGRWWSHHLISAAARPAPGSGR
jgi:tight adherence protein B